MKIYVIFGQEHLHHISGVAFDKDSIAAIECETYADGRNKTFEHFGQNFATTYNESDIMRKLDLFPRGIINVTK